MQPINGIPFDVNYADWYNKAHDYAVNLANSYGITVPQAAGIIAATSVNKSWDENLKCAESFLSTGNARHFGLIQNRCELILSTTDVTEIGNAVFGGTLDRSKGNGNKLFNFFLNILFPDVENGVTIDRHAAEALGCKQPKTPKQYKAIELMYFDLTETINKELGTTYMAHQVQAMVWVAFRENKNGLRYGNHI